jgi:uncharacterized protein
MTLEPQEPASLKVAQLADAQPFGYAMTIVWTLLAFALSAIVALSYYSWSFGSDRLLAMIAGQSENPNIKYDGSFLATIYTVSAIVQVAILAFAIKLKRWHFTEYLALHLPNRRSIFLALSLVIMIVVLSDGAFLLLGRNPVSEFQIISYSTAKAAGSLPLLIVVIVLFAPVSEEIIFRGFLYRGFVQQPSHAPYAILIVSLIFTVIHQQYDLLGLLQIFFIGLAFGVVRWSTGSTALTILMHILANAIATIETVIYVEWMSR